jgi:hypothetical protein
MSTTVSDVLVEVDSRRRVSLGRIGQREHTRYLVHAEADGTIVMTPAVVVSDLEAKFLAAPELVNQLRESMRHPETFRRRERKSS